MYLAQAIALHLEEKYEDAIAALGDDIENKAPSLVKRSRWLCVQYLMCAVYLAQGRVTALTFCVCVMCVCLCMCSSQLPRQMDNRHRRGARRKHGSYCHSGFSTTPYSCEGTIDNTSTTHHQSMQCCTNSSAIEFLDKQAEKEKLFRKAVADAAKAVELDPTSFEAHKVCKLIQPPTHTHAHNHPPAPPAPHTQTRTRTHNFGAYSM